MIVMLVDVKLFARASQLAGVSELQVELATDATVADFRKVLIQQCPDLEPIIAHLFVAINAEYTNDEQSIPADAEIACFPPVSGG